MTYTAHVTGTPESSADEIACVAPLSQDTGSNFPRTNCGTGTVTIDPNLSGVGAIWADLEVDSITPNVDLPSPAMS